MYDLIAKFRKEYNRDDTVLIYTGYYKEEIAEQVEKLKEFKNIIIKFGRFIPNNPGRFDEVLGVYLASYIERNREMIKNRIFAWFTTMKAMPRRHGNPAQE